MLKVDGDTLRNRRINATESDCADLSGGECGTASDCNGGNGGVDGDCPGDSN